MNTELPSYKKVSSKFFTIFVRNSLWQGPDHLLWVERVAMQERYKRFYYRDIQALVVAKNNNQHIWTFIWGALGALFGIVALSVSGTPYVSSIFLGISLLFLFINLLMGPCCRTYIQTAVQREKLKPLVRLRKADAMLNLIKKLVEEQQGILLPDQVPQDTVTAQTMPQLEPVHNLTPEKRNASSGNAFNIIHAPLHWALFGLLSMVGLAGYLQNWLHSPLLSVFEITGIGVLVVLGIATLVRLSGKNASPVLLTFDWLALGIVCMQAAAAYVVFIMASMRNVANTAMPYDFLGVLKLFINLLNEGNPVITAMVLGFGLLSLAVGLIGMILLGRRPRRTLQKTA